MSDLANEPDSSTNGSDFELVNGNSERGRLAARNGGDEEGTDSQASSLSNLELDPRPHPVQIVQVNEDRQFDLDLELLSSVLLHPKCRDRPVVVVSIAGDFRKGKSFMLNFFLRYLYHISSDPDNEAYKESSGGASGNDWLGEKDSPLKGFSWRGGSSRDTTGILLWSEPILVTDPQTKETVAVLLMDTQGAFDSEFTVRDSAIIFALSTMTSSIQVFNLMHNLQEDNLQILELFTEYGHLALETERAKEAPFQKLVFLIRDWSFPYESAYGLDGGMELLEKKLTIKDNQPEQLKQVRRNIKNCFSDIECVLLPHPGNSVATNPNFDGKLSDMDKDFRAELQNFVPHLLSPSSLVRKKIGGQTVTGLQLIEYFKAYISIFHGDTMPEPKSMLEATAEANNLAAVANAKELFMDSMEELCGGDRPFMNPKTLETQRERVHKAAIKSFHSTPKMGGEVYAQKYLERLESELEVAWEHFASQNKSKNMFNLWGTPLVLLICWLFATMVSKLFDLIGISFLANLFFFHSIVAILTMIFYLSAKYTGNFPEFIIAVDGIAEKIWTSMIEKIMELLQQQAQQQMGGNAFGQSPVSSTTASTSRSGQVRRAKKT